MNEEIQNCLSQFQNNKTLTIQNIESFYNYRTIDDDFKLVTSVLSSENSFITLTIKNQNTNYQNFQVIPEEVYEQEPVNLSHLHGKKNRICSALTKIKNAKNMQTETPFYNFFSLNSSFQNETINNEKVLPFNCRDLPHSLSKSKKIACKNCKQLCSYKIEMILHPTKSISHDDILEELEIHGHPKSRKILDENGNKRNRNKIEAARELADHFIFTHNQQEPEFLL